MFFVEIIIFNSLYKHFDDSNQLNSNQSEFLPAGSCVLHYKGHTEIPGLLDASVGRWILDAGRWTLDLERWTLESRHWKLDATLWTLGSGH